MDVGLWCCLLFCTHRQADKDTGLLSLFRALLTIDPKKRISANRALTKSFVRQRTRKA
jgi:hypothetical protein